ncbi:MAG: TolC family protein [Verrucomicrobiales bacterium]
MKKITQSPAGVFDEGKEMTQSRPFMQITRVVCGMILAGAVAGAQDSSSPATQAPESAAAPANPSPTTPGTSQLPGSPIGVGNLNSADALPHPQQPAAFIPPPALRPPLSLVSQTNAMNMRSISLQEAIQMALEQNYGVQIIRFNPQIAGFNLRGSYGVYEPNLNFSATRSFNSSPGGFDPQGIPLPSTEIEEDNLGAGVGSGLGGYTPTGLRYGLNGNLSNREFSGIGGSREQYTGGLGINLQQPLLRDFWIDGPRLEIALNKRNLAISEWQLRDQLIATILAVEEAYYNLIFMRENVRVQQTALTLANQLVSETQKKVAVGQLAPLEERRVESQAAATMADLIAAERGYLVQENTLKNLITSNFSEWINVMFEPVENLVAVPASTDVTESWRRGLTMRPDIQQLKLDLEKRDITLKYLKNQLFPALDLTGSYGHNALNTSYGRTLDDLSTDRNPRYSYGVVLSIPLGNSRARSNYKASGAEKKQALLRYKELEQNIMVEIDNAIKALRSEFQRVEATRQARSFAQEALRVEQAKWEYGKTTSFTVQEAQRDLTLAQYRELEALANYNKALSALAALEGSMLDRHGLSISAQ